MADRGALFQHKSGVKKFISESEIGKYGITPEQFNKKFIEQNPQANMPRPFTSGTNTVNSPTTTPAISPVVTPSVVNSPTVTPVAEPIAKTTVPPQNAYSDFQKMNTILQASPSAIKSPEEQVKQKAPSWLEKTGNFLTENAPTIGGMALGGIGALAAGPFGAVPMAGVGAAAGEAVKRKIKGQDISKQDLEREARSGIASEVIGMGVGKVLSGLMKSGGKILTRDFGKFTASDTLKVIQQHGEDIGTMMNKYIPKFATYDDIIGSKTEKGFGGIFNKSLSDAEKAIQSVAGKVKTTIPGNEILAALKTQRDLLSKQLGNDAKIKAIDEVILEATKKYSKGTTVSNALKTLRAGNEAFGKTVLDVDTSDAVRVAAQKLETNAIREALKMRFPTIANSLDIQSDILTLRPIIDAARSKATTETAGDVFSKINLTAPGTWGNIPKTAGKILEIPEMMPLQGTSKGLPNLATAGTQAVTQPVVSSMLGAKSLPTTPEPLAPATETRLPESIQPLAPKENGKTALPEITKTYEDKKKQLEDYYATMRQSDEYKSGAWDESAVAALEKKDIAANEDWYAKQAAEIKTSGPKQLSSAASRDKSRYEVALLELPKLQKEILEDPSVLYKASIPGSPGATYYRAKYGSLIDIVGTNRTGAAYTPAQRGDYESMLPTWLDSPEQRMKKIKDLETEMTIYLNNINNTNPNEVAPPVQSGLSKKPSLATKVPKKWEYS